MTFLTITHIDDVLPHIDGRQEFVVADRGSYTVVDYVYALPDSFDDPVRRECRGLKFDRSGRIIARGLSKFFNISEKPETQPHLIDFSIPHVITEKLDGSMVHGCVLDNQAVLMTRMGLSDQAKMADALLTDAQREYIKHSALIGYTLIFEFTSPQNRIVIRYDEPQLTLLAVRDTYSGEYLSKDVLQSVAADMHLPLVRHLPSDWNDAQAFVDYARTIRGAEGFVVRFDDGLWVKAKGDDYVLKHRAKDSVMREKNVLALVLRGELDDVIPLLEPDDAVEIEQYRGHVLNGVARLAQYLGDHVAAGEALDQKTFAVEHQLKITPDLRPLAFQIRAGADAYDAVKSYMLRSVGSQTTVDAIRHLHGAEFALNSMAGERE